MARYQVIDTASGHKENVIEADPKNPPSYPGKRVEPDDGSPIWGSDVPQPLQATGKQLRYALNDMGVRTQFDAALAASKQAVKDYWECCGSDFVPVGNPKIAKLCQTAKIDVAALFALAVTE